MTEQPQQQPAPPANAVEARTRLAAIEADKDQGAKIFAGDPAANREWRELVAKAATSDDSTVELAMTGDVHKITDSATKMMAETAVWMRGAGFPEKAIRETLADKAPAPEDIDRARVWKTQAMKNPDFTKRLLDGDGDAMREMTAANIVLTAASRRAAIRDATGTAA